MNDERDGGAARLDSRPWPLAAFTGYLRDVLERAWAPAFSVRRAYFPTSPVGCTRSQAMPLAATVRGTRPPIQVALVALIGVGLVVPLPLPAQLGRPGAERAAPSAYAITNARIVTAAAQGPG